MLLSFLDEEWAVFFLDDHNGHVPAGIAQFGRSRGGHLHDDPRDGRVGTVSLMESWIRVRHDRDGRDRAEPRAHDGSLGLGGFPHFAGYPGAWPAALGFRIETIPLSRTIGTGPGGPGELGVPTPVGLERDGVALIKPFCPPYYRSMEE